MRFIHMKRILTKKKKVKPKKTGAENSGNRAVNGKRNDSFHGRNAITDPRFSSVHRDPRFQKIPSRNRKVSVDSRFKRMFEDERFFSSSTLDKRGKPKDCAPNSVLRHYHMMNHPGVDGGAGTENENRGSTGREDYINTSSTCIPSENLEFKLPHGSSSSLDASRDTDSDIESDSDDGDRDGVESGYMIKEEDIPTTESETRRLAVVNMDWNYVKAVDLYVLLSSFLPKGSHILSVAVYPSEFGVQQMEKEAVHGPVGLFDEDTRENGGNGDDDGDELDNEKVRSYEIRRLRYFFAVVDCGSSSTANHLYKACDGVELEQTSTVLDLRFIPDSMEFKRPPCDTSTKVPSRYERLEFHTRALQQSRVDLSWDEDDPRRVRSLRRKFNPEELAELDLREFLASDETDSEGDEERKKNKCDLYRGLAATEEGEEEDEEDMVVTFNTGLEDLSKSLLLSKAEKGQETVWEASVKKKRKEKKIARGRSSNNRMEVDVDDDDAFHARNDSDDRHEDTVGRVASRAELELLVADEGGRSVRTRLMEKITTSSFDDPRFSAFFTSSSFALDPCDPQFNRKSAPHMALRQQPNIILEEEFLAG